MLGSTNGIVSTLKVRVGGMLSLFSQGERHPMLGPVTQGFLI